MQGVDFRFKKGDTNYNYIGIRLNEQGGIGNESFKAMWNIQIDNNVKIEKNGR